jgi:WD40 repeat protein
MGRVKVSYPTGSLTVLGLCCFLTAGYGRTAPISNLTFPTSTETVSSVRFNLSEASVLASVGSDRTFTLYDIRTGKAERRVIMQVSQRAMIFRLGVAYSYLSPSNLDAKQFVGMVANIPNNNTASIRRSQPVYV